MKRTLLILAALLAPVVLSMAMGMAGCGEEHRYRDGDRDRDRTERHEGDRR